MLQSYQPRKAILLKKKKKHVQISQNGMLTRRDTDNVYAEFSPVQKIK